MPVLKVGLAPNRAAFYDPKTNINLNLSNPIREIYYDDNTDLSGICHAIMCQQPALILYEGKLPQQVVDQWLSKYEIVLKQVKNRVSFIQEKSSDIVAESVKQQSLIENSKPEEEIKASSVEIEEKKEVETEIEELFSEHENKHEEHKEAEEEKEKPKRGRGRKKSSEE